MKSEPPRTPMRVKLTTVIRPGATRETGEAPGSGSRLLLHPWLPLWLALLAAVLALPSLGVGLLFDDYHHKLLMQHSNSPLRLLSSPWDMFRLLSGDTRQTAALIDYGMLPWWADVGIKGAFWRPIASATHWLDYTLWPDTPALMHAQSIAWYALLVGVVAFLYRRIMGVCVAAGLAGLLYAMDCTHATPIIFLANRNALIAATLGVLCLAAHERWRREGSRVGALAAPMLLVLGLLAKEEAIATCGYLAAFVLCLDDAPWRRRIASLVPYALVVIFWRIAWLRLGYGVAGLGLYVDPLREPVRFAHALVERVPLLLLSQLSTIPADLSMLTGHRGLQALIAVVILGGVAAVAWPTLRSQRSARFWLVGMVLSLVPASTTFPSDRMLLFAGIGAMGLIAQLLVAAFSCVLPGGRLRRAAARGLVWVLIILHIVVAPIALFARTSPIGPRLAESLYIRHPLDRTVETQDLVIVNPPAALGFLAATPFIWASEQAPMPRHLRVLTSSCFYPVLLRRTDERTLLVRPRVGFLASEPDRLFNGSGHVFSVGQQLHFTGMDVRITAVGPDRRPIEAAFQFAVPLDDQSLRWLQWGRGGYQPFTPPPVGGSVTLQAGWRDMLASPR